MTVFRILAIDGGGIRGLIPSILLSHIEAETQKPISELFDLIVGTSTGALIALGLTKPVEHEVKPKYSAEDLVQFYVKEGPRIFDPDTRTGLFSRAYPVQTLESVLGAYFGESRLRHTLTEVIVNSYDIENRLPFIFRSVDAKRSKRHDYFMRDVGRAATAAPTYFEPALVFPADHYEEVSFANSLIDGGVYVNNPAMAGIVEAIRHLSTPNTPWPQFLVVSLGTGSLVRKFLRTEVRKWSGLRWAKNILDIVFDGQSDHIDDQLETILGTGSPIGSYYRFQARLVKAKDDLDDASDKNLDLLQRTARDILSKERGEFEGLCKTLAMLANDRQNTLPQSAA